MDNKTIEKDVTTQIKGQIEGQTGSETNNKSLNSLAYFLPFISVFYKEKLLLSHSRQGYILYFWLILINFITLLGYWLGVAGLNFNTIGLIAFIGFAIYGSYSAFTSKEQESNLLLPTTKLFNLLFSNLNNVKNSKNIFGAFLRGTFYNKKFSQIVISLLIIICIFYISIIANPRFTMYSIANNVNNGTHSRIQSFVDTNATFSSVKKQRSYTSKELDMKYTEQLRSLEDKENNTKVQEDLDEMNAGNILAFWNYENNIYEEDKGSKYTAKVGGTTYTLKFDGFKWVVTNYSVKEGQPILPILY